MKPQTAPPARFLSTDEEGYFYSDGVRWSDQAIGFQALANLVRNENGIFSTTLDGQTIIVEPFDEPLVAKMVHHTEDKKNSTWKIQTPYNFEVEFQPSELTVDEWDRFHGHTRTGVPFVFSRAAQSEFFNLVDEFDDEGITIDGKYIKLREWLSKASEPGQSQFWSEIYKTSSELPWELETGHAAFTEMVKKTKLQKSRVLVLGAGGGHDAALLADMGHVVTAIDFSPEAVALMKQRYGSRENLKIIQADIFSLDHTWHDKFDVIAEHTCFCAIPPSRRNELVRLWSNLLVHDGYVMGIFFAMDRPDGPPYGGSEYEIRERLQSRFQSLFWTRWHESVPARRMGAELVVVARKF